MGVSPWWYGVPMGVSPVVVSWSTDGVNRVVVSWSNDGSESRGGIME